ncbi:helix-turn-helix transcriptional regulator [Isoptericola halotolerans]|uniref:helix-turn-helix domain-containing protein n=1 Tax=Isoptericola halotolerans TaxID=300560 RepID=UPI00388DF962
MSSSDLGDFLRSRRAALRPEDVGIRGYGARRVPGLRREELAMLAGVSPTYYARLEQGLSTNASESVIGSLAKALELGPDEQAHLFELARPKRSPRRRAAAKPDRAREGMLRLVRSIPDTPAVILGRRSEVLGWNSLGHRLVGGHLAFDGPELWRDRPNMTRMLFLDEHTKELYKDWGGEAERAVASLRVLSGKNRDDPELTALIGELTVKSPEFCSLWGRHPVHRCVSGVKRFRHPEVGDLDLEFEVLTPPDDSEHRILMYTAASSEAASTLALLAREATQSVVTVSPEREPDAARESGR